MRVGRSRFETALRRHLGFLKELGYSEPVVEQEGDEWFARYAASGTGETIAIRCAEDTDFLEFAIEEPDGAEKPVAVSNTGREWTEELFESEFTEQSEELKERLGG
jgi:hypothetical protein